MHRFELQHRGASRGANCSVIFESLIHEYIRIDVLSVYHAPFLARLGSAPGAPVYSRTQLEVGALLFMEKNNSWGASSPPGNLEGNNIAVVVENDGPPSR